MGGILWDWLQPWIRTPAVAPARVPRTLSPEEQRDAQQRQRESEQRSFTQWNDPSRRWR